MLRIFSLISQVILVVVPILMGLAYLTLLERKIMGAAHRRYGPNVVGLSGVLQPVVDGVKLIFKESVFPETSGKLLFIFAPILTFFLSMLGWLVIPFDEVTVVCDINLGILYLFSVSTLTVYAVVLAGWSSNSRYALLGGLRSAAQMVSYEISLGVIVLSVVACVGSLNLVEIVVFQEAVWLIVPLFPMFVLFFLSTVAETNRAPFDLPEAETELVSGYNVEYSAVGFSLFFMGEYGSILLMSTLSVLLFLGGWLPICSLGLEEYIPGFVWFGFKLLIILFWFVWVRVSFPRYRYDQLMRLGWKVFLPLSLGWLVVLVLVLFSCDWLCGF